MRPMKAARCLNIGLWERNEMKTIWLVNPYGPIEGENWREYSFNQFGKFLSAKGYKVIWWTASFSHHFKKQRSQGWKDVVVNDYFIIRLVPTTSYTKNFGIGRMYKDFVFGINASKGFKDETKPDLIIAAENPITMGNPSYKYAKKNNIPMIYDQMDIWPEFIVSNLKKPLSTIADVLFIPVCKRRKKIYDSLSGSIALGKHYLEFMHEVSPGLKNKPHALVYNGIDVKEFRSHLSDKVTIEIIPPKKPGDIWCVFAGTLGPSYDIGGIIECAERCSKSGLDNFKFIIAGSGPFESELRESERKISNLIYIGKLLPKDLIPVYGKCDIGLSTYSAGSNVDMCDKFYDYTAAGLAILNSLTGEISEHISNKGLGENYIANNTESMWDALMRLKDQQDLQKRKFNSRLAGDYFDKNIQNEKLLEVIQQLI